VWLEVRETRIVLPDEVYADVNPLTAPVGDLFVIQQHHATALHHDFRLEMSNGDEPVLVSWAVPKGLPRRRGQRHLAIRTPDHSMDHAEFTGTIPNDEYGGGVVRMFDRGPYEMVGRTHDRLTFRLDGDRLKGVWHLVLTGVDKGKEQWLAMMSQDLRPEEEERPKLEPMLTTPTAKAFDDPNFWFEPHWAGLRVLASCGEETRLVSNGADITDRFPELERLHNQVVALDAVLDGEIVAFDDGVPSASRLRQRLDEDDRRIAVAYLALFLESFVVPIMYRHNLTVIPAWKAFLPWLSAETVSFVLYGLFVLLLTVGAMLGIGVIGFATCCVGFFFLMLPYVGTVLLLPLLVTYRYLSLEFLAQFHPSLSVFPTPPTITPEPTPAES
jgi:DNA ligase D-like protein (predicted 3'-phosphoesterase)